MNIYLLQGVRLTHLKIDIDLRTDVSSSSSSGTQETFEGQNNQINFNMANNVSEQGLAHRLL